MTEPYWDGYRERLEDEQDAEAYELDDPKHPTFLDRLSDWADAERKRQKEER